MSASRALLWLAVAALGGCAAPPFAKPPSLPARAGDAFVTASATVDSVAQPPAGWWRLYDDSELTALVREALGANTDIRIALGRVAQSHAVAQEARAGRTPTTQLSAAEIYGRNLIADSIAGSLHRQAENLETTLVGIDLSYELDLHGRVTASIDAATADADAAEAAADAVRVAVAAETTRAWASARSAVHELIVARRSLAIAEETAAIVARQVMDGAATNLELSRVRVLADQARGQLPLFEGRRRAAHLELALLLGRAPSAMPAIGLDESSPRLAMPLPVGDGASLLARRPDLRQAERRLAAANSRVAVAAASLYPRVVFGASLGFASNEVLRGSNAVNLAIGPMVSWSFPNQVIARARIAQSNAAAGAALATFDGVVLRALKEVEQAISACDVETAHRAALAAAEADATEVYRLSGVRRRNGAASRLEVVLAEQTLLNASAAVAAADSRVVDAQIALFLALGGGWQRSAIASD